MQISEEQLENTEFEVLKVGEYYDHRYGKFSVTQDLLEELKENFESNVLDIEVALDANHQPENGAYAWVRELTIHTGAHGELALFAKFKDFTEDALKFFKQKMFRYFSVEFAPFTKVVDGKKETVKNVLKGIALTNRPVIKGMQPTFLSEEVENNVNHDRNMQNVKLFAANLLKRDAVSKDDVDALMEMFRYFSVEFAPFTKVVDGKKETVKNVLKGIALTNRPVIKGMQPTFLSEEVENNVNHDRNMQNVKLFAANLLKRDAVSKDDVDALMEMHALLSEEEQAEVKDDVAKVEAKAEESGEAEAEGTEDAAQQEGAGDEAEAETTPEGEDEPEEDAPEGADLSEDASMSLSEQKELADLREFKQNTVLSERVGAVTLSSDNLTGFAKDSNEAVSEFVRTLSDDQWGMFQNLVGSVKTVDASMLSEEGSDDYSEAGGDATTEDAKLSEVNKRADEIVKEEGLARHLAVEKAQKEILN